MSLRRPHKLGDLVDIRHGYAFLGRHFGTSGSHIVLTPGNFEESGGFRFQPDKAKWYSGPIPSDYVLQQGDLIVAMTEQGEGLLGSAALVPESGKFLHNQRLGLVKQKCAEMTDRRYLYYLLNSAPVRQAIRATASGTKVRHTSPSRICDVRVDLPSPEEQRRIAGILSAYDDLIENCQRRIRILEEMARRLYREWFVHFRYPGHESIPLIPSPLGPIPQGWELKTLGDLIATNIGGGWGKDVPVPGFEGPAWVIRGTDIPAARNNEVAKVPFRYHSASNLRSRRLESGDIIFEVSGGSKGQPVGRSLLVTPQLLSAFGGDDVICASFCKRVTPAQATSPEWLWLSFLEGYENGEIEQFQVQSTGISNFKWTEYLVQTRRAVPSPEVKDRFTIAVQPLIAAVRVLGLQTANLRRTRDLLLPRLLGGSIG